MTVLREAIRQEASTGIAAVDAADELPAFLQPDCPALIWRRHPSPCFQKWVDAFEPERLPRARVILPPKNVAEAISLIFDNCNTPDGPQSAMLAEDTALQAQAFADLMRTPFLRLRYDVVSTNACRKFHIDVVTARLICTYRGPGTQFGFPEYSDVDPAYIYSVATGSAILLRGKLWPESPDAGLRHRSPPIEGTGQTRLVLVLDPIADPDEHSDPKFL